MMNQEDLEDLIFDLTHELQVTNVVLSKLIGYLVLDLGDHNVKLLLDELHENAKAVENDETSKT